MRRALPVPDLLDVVAPAIPVAQAIGRSGNWFNQELYGRPTDLPWALRIDPEHRPGGLGAVATDHPTFLYEAVLNLGLAAVLVLVARRWDPRPGQLFTGYVAEYAAGRFWVEVLRIDPATEVLGMRVNLWVSAVVFVAAVAVLAVRRRNLRREAEADTGAVVACCATRLPRSRLSRCRVGQHLVESGLVLLQRAQVGRVLRPDELLVVTVGLSRRVGRWCRHLLGHVGIALENLVGVCDGDRRRRLRARRVVRRGERRQRHDGPERERRTDDQLRERAHGASS